MVQEKLKDGDGFIVGGGLVKGRLLGVVAETLRVLTEGALGDGVGEGEREKATR